MSLARGCSYEFLCELLAREGALFLCGFPSSGTFSRLVSALAEPSAHLWHVAIAIEVGLANPLDPSLGDWEIGLCRVKELYRKDVD